MTSPDSGEMYHLSGGSSLLGHLSSKLMAELRDGTFRPRLLMEALKLQLSLRAWGPFCSVVSLTHIKDKCVVG